ncbi:hypothetical protein L2E82_32970 [Cichorium intybus]|uniref:Uncharacterized protein n=1 Tax=Cichorium intybus TaxID=13427 RepID=A0ACB9BIN1_CICIN|nr:hypothetical protein L2E82_32970 [Cichorium intybus]
MVSSLVVLVEVPSENLSAHCAIWRSVPNFYSTYYFYYRDLRRHGLRGRSINTRLSLVDEAVISIGRLKHYRRWTCNNQ